jgi:L-arabinose isomerase
MGTDLVKHIKAVKENWANIGVMYTGLFQYWPQFPGLKKNLLKHCKYFFEKIKKEAPYNFIEYDDICDRYETSKKAGKFFAARQLDLLICFITTYTPSAYATIVFNQIPGVPVLLVSLQPELSLDYDKSSTEKLLENVNITSLPEITNALKRAGREPLDCIVGNLYDDQRAWEKILDWCKVADTAHKLHDDHIGILGHVYEGMLDMSSDPTMFDSFFGMHVEHLEMEDLERYVDKVTQEQANKKIKEILGLFGFPDPVYDPITKKVERKDLAWPAKVSVAMDKLVAGSGLTGLSYFYRGMDDNKFERMHAGMIIGNSLLTSKGISVSGEQDLKNCVAMLIMSRFEAGGTFAELYPIDFKDDHVLVGHDGPHHLQLAEGKPVLRKLTTLHGKRGSGPSVEYRLKSGPITILGLTQTYNGRFKLVIAEGVSIDGTIPAIGNTATRTRFSPDVRTFVENWSREGPTHHFALGIGHIAGKIKMLAKYLDMEAVLVTQ